MKKIKILLLVVVFPFVCMGEGAYHEYNEVIVRAGVMNSDLRYGENLGGTINISYIPFEINSCGIGWNANFTKTKDYYSFSPIGAGATLIAVMSGSMSVDSDNWVWKALCCMAAESIKNREAVTKTACLMGKFKNVPALREEMYNLIRLKENK